MLQLCADDVKTPSPWCHEGCFCMITLKSCWCTRTTSQSRVLCFAVWQKKAFIAQILLYFQKLVWSHKNMSWSFDNFNLVWSWGERKQKRETSSLVFWIYSNFCNSTSTHILAIFEKKDPVHLIQTSKWCLYLLFLFPTLLPQLWAHRRHSVNNFE